MSTETVLSFVEDVIGIIKYNLSNLWTLVHLLLPNKPYSFLLS